MIIVLNHKSNLEKEEYQNYITDFSTIKTKHKLVVCPSFINLGLPVSNEINLGSQNISTYNSGAHTGEISSAQLKSYNIKYTIIGHSERRKEQKENLLEINKKIKQAEKNNIIPILCIGETKKERANGEVEAIIKEEILSAIEDLTEKQKEKLIIAYEPIWSIGTGLIPSNKDIIKATKYIKKLLPKAKVLYGGSVNEENIDIIKKIQDIDGYLIGGLSLNIEKIKILLEKLD